MRVALDTNVLAYAEGIGSEDKRDSTLKVLEALDASSMVLPAQVLGELFRVLTGKAGRTALEARAAVLSWADGYPVAESTWSAFGAAFDLCADHGLSVWDALILSVAAEQQCRVLLSEDLQHGFTSRGVTVVNPYVASMHPLLEEILAV
ncbi:MAG: PIN domain-containing protein [Gammaproteobacteria bacterium]|nr:PIN domain-containing protein [Gammaproteobacteria bacterium]MDE1888575.1 PIN domain-containing protein [Gammaproteobacteria bacterium]MDE2024777.1 PIN domain-containing protein [Gammaproteobacteria bacterium]MDE2272605.1 PIN domain-containing protein [Gammaproteobacteria bacterium]